VRLRIFGNMGTFPTSLNPIDGTAKSIFFNAQGVDHWFDPCFFCTKLRLHVLLLKGIL
jgi:hypothetical protein